MPAPRESAGREAFLGPADAPVDSPPSAPAPARALAGDLFLIMAIWCLRSVSTFMHHTAVTLSLRVYGTPSKYSATGAT
eukprot:13355350-Alexandrium_andersonii.AAC.1